LEKIYQDYNGKMFEFKSNNINNTVTPNHRFLLEDNKGVRFYMTAEEIYEDVGGIYSSGKNKILKNRTENIIENDTSKINHIWVDKRTIKINKIDYNGKIACVRVPNGNFYTKVNGKAHWTGNSSVIALHNLSHRINKMWWKDNILFGTLEIFTSPGYMKDGYVSMVGDKIVEYLKKDVKLGISSRGIGSLKDEKGKQIVQDDFELICFDLVVSPSTPGAYLFVGEGNVGVKENEFKSPTITTSNNPEILLTIGNEKKNHWIGALDAFLKN